MGFMDWARRRTGIGASQDRYIDDWLKGIERDYLTAAGLRVSAEDALGVPGLAACIQVLSEDLAKVPLVVKRRTADGFDPATDHPLHNLLKYRPAPWISSYAFRKALIHQVLVHGNGFARVARSVRGDVQQISLIQNGKCQMRWADDGEPFFDQTVRTGVIRSLTWQDVIHVPYRASNDGAENGGVFGISPIKQHRETVALALAAERFAARFFANGARPSLVLEMDKKLPNDDVAKRIRESVERLYAGADNAHKIAILELGMKARELSSNPQESQLMETRKEHAVQACTLYRVPPHKIGVLDHATYDNIEQESINYVTGPLSALAKAVESAIEIACLAPHEQEDIKVEHNLEGLLRGDILSRYRAYAIGRQWGWLSADDCRISDNMNRLPDGQGATYLSPLNMQPANADPAQNDPTPPPKQRKKAYGQLLGPDGRVLMDAIEIRSWTDA